MDVNVTIISYRARWEVKGNKSDVESDSSYRAVYRNVQKKHEQLTVLLLEISLFSPDSCEYQFNECIYTHF